MACVVCPTRYRSGLVPDGILDHKTLSTIWPQKFRDPVTDQTRVLAPDAAIRKLLLELLHRFGLAIRLKDKDGTLLPRSLVPAMMNVSNHAEPWRTWTSGIKSNLDFVPQNLVPQILLRAYCHAPPGDNAVSRPVDGSYLYELCI